MVFDWHDASITTRRWMNTLHPFIQKNWSLHWFHTLKLHPSRYELIINFVISIEFWSLIHKSTKMAIIHRVSFTHDDTMNEHLILFAKTVEIRQLANTWVSTWLIVILCWLYVKVDDDDKIVTLVECIWVIFVLNKHTLGCSYWLMNRWMFISQSSTTDNDVISGIQSTKNAYYKKSISKLAFSTPP